jgi:hypothetical protein
MVDVTKSHFGLLVTENGWLFSCLAFRRRKTADFFPAWPFGDGKQPTFFLLDLLATENGRLFSCSTFWQRKKSGETLGESLVVPEPAVRETNRRVEGQHPSCKERN